MNINELAEYATDAAERVRAFLTDQDGDIVDVFTELGAAGGALGVVANYLNEIAEAQPVLTDGELALHTLIAAASMARAGDITLDEFHEITARESFRCEGIEPTSEQLATRVSEFRTANSFISAVARGE